MATPQLISATADLDSWKNEISQSLKADLQEYIYGYLPDDQSTILENKRAVSDSAFNETARVDEYLIKASAVFDEVESAVPSFNMVLISPAKANGPVPVILMQTFCPNHSTVPVEGVSIPANINYSCDGGGIGGKLMTFIFGRYIATPPFEDILKRGFAVATIFPSEYVPDNSNSGLKALKELSPGHDDDETRWGAIAAWAWGYGRMIDAIEKDDKFNASSYFAYGHSRYGKSALLAAVFDDRIDGVISHQSGTGGASLNKEKKGESVGEITETYPHWFSNKYASYSDRETEMPIDQHAVLALIAPRPIFLGNARRDVWSDPNGAFRAAQGASAIYKLYNKQGLNQDKLKPFIPENDISFYIRKGTHGVVKEDWPAFLDFLDAHAE
ncbi:MAG: alpha/beta hydrolase [Acidimicrobiales bacterium]|nr:alpha/beta hydrolase [Hyphomonadaceae bacterium]RZV40609.1 MAG: alpha/beta hydrolase [Acidimicrobiales bacterium]